MIDLIISFRNKCSLFKIIGKNFNVTEREVQCLTYVDSEEFLSSKALSSMMNLSASRGSRIVGKLIQKGFLTVKKDSVDRRSVLISLTKRGKDCMKSIEEEKKICEDRLLQRLTSDEVLKVKEGFNLLLKAMDAE